MPGFHIRTLTEDDDLDAFGQIVLDSYLALPDMPREPDYEAELVDVAARVRGPDERARRAAAIRSTWGWKSRYRSGSRKPRRWTMSR